MADEKRTKIGATGPVRAQVNTPASASASVSVPAESHSYLPPAVDPLIGQTLVGRYQIQKKLGEGGMGAVYLATHNVLEKQVALKVLHGELGRKPDLVERFMQEAKAASRIRHENVIDISDFGITPDGLVFFAMELLTGHDLHEEIARARLAGQLLPWSRSKRIFLQICAALSAAHALGIIHRDLKPENVYLVEFLDEPDFVKLLDFGIAKLTEVSDGDRKLTRTGMLFGTPEYMSPEQARGEQVDPRVDVYAMACILFQLVTGRVPFESDNFMGVLSLHLTEAPPQIPPEVFDRIGAPRELANVIARGLEKDRELRWQTINELATAVRLVSGDPVPTSSPGTPVPRAPSVDAPPRTTEKAVRVSGSQSAPGRQRTEWTGSLQVPHTDDAPQARFRLPLILGAVLVLGAGAVAAVVVAGRDDAKSEAPAKVASTPSGAAPVGAASGAPAPTTPPAALPPVPARVMIKLDSIPSGARVRDLETGAILGKTPRTFKVDGSRQRRQFELVLAGYADAIVEVVPDREPLEHTEQLVKGKPGVPAARAAGSGSASVPGSGPGSGRPPTGSAKPPEPASGSATPAAGSATPAVPPAQPGSAKPPKEECEDPPCIKTVIPEFGSAGSGG